jgi:hypothetical protein
MKKMTMLDRLLLLLTGLIAAYQIVVGVEDLNTLPMVSYTVGFGVLLVAGLLLIILGFEVLESPWVVTIATLIPLSLSLGLVWQYLVAWRIPYLIFVLIGFSLVAYTRATNKGKISIFSLAIVHGVAGLMIFILPPVASISGWARPGFWLVGLGGALIGLGGLLLSFLRAGKPLLSQERIFQVLPGLLLLMTTAFVIGFALA